MDRRPTVETRPPALIDTLVRLSIPPACREHVIGDLWERYRAPRAFLLDAIRTVPFVIASQIRRTSKIAAVFIQAFVLIVGFAVGTGGLVASIVPVVAALLGLVLRDAYRSCISVSAGQVARDVTVGAAFVLASQAGLALQRSDLLLPLPGVIGGALAFGTVFCLRLQNPGLGAQPRQGLVQPPTSLEALLAEVRLHERLSVRAVRVEMCAGVAVGAFFIVPMLSAQNWLLRVGWALATAYGLYVAVVISRKRPQPMPEGLGFTGSLSFYRATLERQHETIRTMWRWYALPFAPALLFIMAGMVLVALERGRPIWPVSIFAAVTVGMGLLVHSGSQDMARKLRLRIEALASAEQC